MQAQRLFLIPSAIALAAAMTLTACDRRDDDRTVGQAVDSAIAKTEQKSEQVANAVKKEADSAMASAEKGVDTAGSKVRDAAITTSINAELARDASLSALKIDVDTSNGRVALRGTAPDAKSRERATLLAQRVDGVRSVDNELQVRN